MPAAKTVYLVDGTRTPFLVQSPDKQCYSALDLAMVVARIVLVQQPFSAQNLDTIVLASSLCDNSVDLAQQLAQRLHCSGDVSTLVQTGESAGLKAFEYASQQIALNQKQLVLVGAMDAFQAHSFVMNKSLNSWVKRWKGAKGIGGKFKALVALHTQHFGFSEESLSEYPGFSNYQESAEKKAIKQGISKDQMTEYVQLSLRRLQYAQRNNLIASLSPLFYQDGRVINRDESIINTEHADASSAILTDDNMAKASEGAAMLLLASEEAVNQYKLPVLAKITSSTWGDCSQKNSTDTRINDAVEQLLAHNKLSLDQIDYWECNEASAVDILTIQQQCQEDPKISSLSNVNIDGGTLALGSPPSANVFRMVMQLAHILQRNDAKQGVVTSTSSNGLEYALLLEAAHE